ncbi:hypothetical protein Cgig2_002757 [Carnegiea gigantea]|uniref:Uncharacterized protein n=1 Tax=Carnegiea gigantea TaxID=171969 RepID=A0A9Q1JLN1_9CARY|nr:hypothetical protein Cgig2_002757 [Carnegiea gigantea]
MHQTPWTMTRRLNHGRTGTPKVGMMVEQILQRGDYGEEFKRDFVLYVYYQKHERLIFVIILKLLVDVNQPLYLDRAEFRGKRGKEQWFPIANIGQLIQLDERKKIKRCSLWDIMPEIIAEDVHSILALPMSPLEVHIAWTYKPKNKYTKLLEQWRRRLNHRRTGTPKAGMVVEQIQQRGDYREEFKRDFVLFVYYQKKETQVPMVSHSKHRTTDPVEQKNKYKKKFPGGHGRGKTIAKMTSNHHSCT